MYNLFGETFPEKECNSRCIEKEASKEAVQITRANTTLSTNQTPEQINYQEKLLALLLIG